jgi:DNA-binding transcriptional MerR regulator
MADDDAQRDTFIEMTSVEVAERCRVSYRQLDYWVRAGYLPITSTRPGSGVKRLWSFDEVRVAEAFAALMHAGVDPHAIAEALPSMLLGGDWFAAQLGALTVTGPLL